jgi:hypothetical protein
MRIKLNDLPNVTKDKGSRWMVPQPNRLLVQPDEKAKLHGIPGFFLAAPSRRPADKGQNKGHHHERSRVGGRCLSSQSFCLP